MRYQPDDAPGVYREFHLDIPFTRRAELVALLAVSLEAPDVGGSDVFGANSCASLRRALDRETTVLEWSPTVGGSREGSEKELVEVRRQIEMRFGVAVVAGEE